MKYCRIDGGVAGDAREEMIEDFMRDDRYSLVCLCACVFLFVYGCVCYMRDERRSSSVHLPV